MVVVRCATVSHERFTIRAGGRPSWEVGPFAAQGVVSGSNGFAGFPDYTAGTWTRANVALYGDVERCHVSTEVTFEDGRKGSISADLLIRDASGGAAEPMRAAAD